MGNLRLTLACGKYDRTRALLEGKVTPEGIDLIYLPLLAAEIFWRMLRFHEFEISEMSLSNYITECCEEKPRFVAIPVFPSRMFRHGYIFINRKSGIKKAEDLKGKKVGIGVGGRMSSLRISFTSGTSPAGVSPENATMWLLLPDKSRSLKVSPLSCTPFDVLCT